MSMSDGPRAITRLSPIYSGVTYIQTRLCWSMQPTHYTVRLPSTGWKQMGKGPLDEMAHTLVYSHRTQVRPFFALLHGEWQLTVRFKFTGDWTGAQ